MFTIRHNRGPHGSKPLTAERATYLALIAGGATNSTACATVGVNIRTGKRWRNGRGRSGTHGGAPPITTTVPRHDHPVTAHTTPEPATAPSWYLTETDRLTIADLLRNNTTRRGIARILARPVSTITREIHRNSDPDTGTYHPHLAHAHTLARRPRPKTRKIEADPALHDAVHEGLRRKWSPQQISETLRRDHPQTPGMHVAPETIYQTLYLQGRGELRREIASALRSGRARRVTRRDLGYRQPRFTHPMVMIGDRPTEIEDRAMPGHWEGDLIIGKNGASRSGPSWSATPATRCWCTCPTAAPPSRSAKPSSRSWALCPSTWPGH
jgi:IS30 family transposase